MEKIAHRELRNNSSSILARVGAGESFEITNNGVVKAVISPAKSTSLERLLEGGAVRVARTPISEILDLPRDRGLDSLDVLTDLRGDR